MPLLWIDTLALNEAPFHWLLTLLLGVCGAILFSKLFSHSVEIVNFRSKLYASLAAGIWFLIGIGPRLMNSVHLMWIILAVMILTGVLTNGPHSSQEHRFEQSTLSSLLPIFCLYVFLLALFFPFSSLAPWHGFFGLTDRMNETSLFSLYSRVEYLAAFTVLGYLIGEWRGRLEKPLSKEVLPIILIASAIALLAEILSGFKTGGGASFVRLILVISGAVFGGSIYHLSRTHIRYLLGR